MVEARVPTLTCAPSRALQTLSRWSMLGRTQSVAWDEGMGGERAVQDARRLFARRDGDMSLAVNPSRQTTTTSRRSTSGAGPGTRRFPPTQSTSRSRPAESRWRGEVRHPFESDAAQRSIVSDTLLRSAGRGWLPTSRRRAPPDLFAPSEALYVLGELPFELRPPGRPSTGAGPAPPSATTAPAPTAAGARIIVLIRAPGGGPSTSGIREMGPNPHTMSSGRIIACSDRSRFRAPWPVRPRNATGDRGHVRSR